MRTQTKTYAVITCDTWVADQTGRQSAGRAAAGVCGDHGFRSRVRGLSEPRQSHEYDGKRDRLGSVLPLSPGRAERHGFEYSRYGPLSLYAALDVMTGKVEGKTAKRHTSAEFIAFLA